MLTTLRSGSSSDCEKCASGWWYPSQEEAEYTAELVYAVAVWAAVWAVQVKGFAMRVPRMPAAKPSGPRLMWTRWPAETLRSEAMLPVALRLGLAGLRPQCAEHSWC